MGAPLLALAAFALALFAAEAVARIGWDPPRYHNEPLRFDPELGFRGIPGRHRIDGHASADGAPHVLVLNRDGFRGRPLPLDESADPPGPAARARRIAFVGDSFVLGAGVREEQLLSSRVAEALAARGEATSTWNLAAADYGTGQELLLLRSAGEQIEPDAVVLAIYPHNDLINNFEGLAFRTEVSPGDYLRPYVVPHGDRLEIRYTHPLRAWLRRHSRLFALLERRAVDYGGRRRLAWLFPFEPPTPPAVRIRRGLAPREPQEIYRTHPPDSDWERAWQRTTDLLTAFRDTCDALGARLVVVVIPELHQVRRVAQDVAMDLRLRQLQHVPLDRYLDWNLPERRLARFFAQQGIESALLLPRLRSAVSRGEQVYLPDRHLNARGHELAAQAILEVLDGGARPGRRLAQSDPELGGGPVPLPAASRAPRVIQPARQEHWLYRGDSWIPWQASPDQPAGGALPLQHAVVAVPVRGEELVVSGIAAARHYPLDVMLELVSGPRRSFTIQQPGPFVLRTRVPAARLRSSDGYAALVFSARDGRAAEASSTGLIVREVGFPGI
jgi:hypothetical protein